MKLRKITQLIAQLNGANPPAIDLGLLWEHIERRGTICLYLELCGLDLSFLDDLDRAELTAEWQGLKDNWDGQDHDHGASLLIELLSQGIENRVGSCDRISTIAGVEEARVEALEERKRLSELRSRYEDKPWWTSTYELLRGGLWHVTGSEGFRGIRSSGWIDTEKGKMRGWSEKSYARLHRYNALFDFRTAVAPEEECLRNWLNIRTILEQHELNVWLQLDHQLLADKLIPNSKRRVDLTNSDLFIPFVEAWYPDPIPSAAIIRGVIFSKASGYEFKGITDLNELGDALDAAIATMSPNVITPER